MQRQPRKPAVRTVQGVVEQALRQLGWQGQSILVAGRTDTGVHASGQVITFDLDWRHTLNELQAALNVNLPQDVAARSVKAVQPDFHPRYAAIARQYTYRLCCQEIRDPLRERYAWRVWPAVMPEHMEQATHALVGTHDFAAFGQPPHRLGSTVRTVYQSVWRIEADEVIYTVEANAFLYHMVRRLVAVQVAIGQGRLEPDVLQQALVDKQPLPVYGLAPAQGLCLVKVVYPVEDIDIT